MPTMQQFKSRLFSSWGRSLPWNLRPIAVLVGLLGFASFYAGLLFNGVVSVSTTSFLTFLLVWTVGLAMLVIWPTWIQRYDGNLVVFSRALWCGAGCVMMALIVDHPIRVLILVVPVFGVCYAALHLSRKNVALICFITWMIYNSCLLLLGWRVELSLNFELLCYSAFVFLLVAGFLIAEEILRMRHQLYLRNDSLQEMTQQLQELALQDELTGVHNRRHILEVLERQKALADRTQQAFTVCYCDLDHFKRLNDNYGHAAGDKALQNFAQLAQNSVRTVDYVARIGGEEFLLLLVGADAHVSELVTHRLRVGTHQLNVAPEDEHYRLSVSVGVTQYRANESIDSLLRRADEALYKAKMGGRDRVVMES